ncbi:MAG: response regulator [Lewinella sp.]|nr:response regulator [Lewinella sp.]
MKASPSHTAGGSWLDRYLADERLNHEALLTKKVSFQWFLVAAMAIVVLTLFAFIIGARVIGHFGLWLLPWYVLFFPMYRRVEHYQQYNYWFLFIIIGIAAVYIGRCGGILHSGGLIFVGLNCAFSSILMSSTRRTIAIFGWYVLTIIVLGIIGPSLPVHPDMTPTINNLFFTINTIWLSAAQMMFILSYFQEKNEIKEREARRLQELDEAKTRLYTNITHEFRTPLTVILGMADQLKRGESAVRDTVRLIRQNGRRLLHLVNQLLSLARLESGLEPIHWTCTDVAGFLRYLVASYQSMADQRQLTLDLETSVGKICMDLDQEKWEVIIGNLLANALKFTPAGGRVTVGLHRVSETELQVQVVNSGPAIPAEHLPHLFDRFYQVEHGGHRQEGSGVGLTLVREYCELLGGRVAVDSSPDEGTVFMLRFPIHQEAPEGPTHFARPVATKVALEEEKVEPQEVVLPRRDLPLVLLVEDNVDLVYYLRGLLHHDYRVFTAANGEEGLALAREQVPDIIISDVMMPVMDGMQLLKALKSDQRTSHIPVIMLTAKTDQSSRLAGLDEGAEAYLSKPFEKEELFIRLRKLLELRRTLQARYAALEERPEPAPPGFALEDQFMARVSEVLALHLDDEHFGIAELCRELAMSRTQVYRKFAALTDMTVNQYLRRYRLREARRLLRETDLSVSQVALEVGLPNLSYFSRVFTETFGVNPSQLRSATST